jgi:hypothetical protein
VDFQNGSRLSESDLDTAYQQGLFVAQEVSENASTNIEGIGPQGPQGIQGVAGNDGADGVTSTVALTESFESSEQALTDGAMSIEVAHGLGSVPKVFQVVARCKTTEGSYAVGDEILIADSRGNISTHGNATNVGLVTAAGLYFMNKTTNAYFLITTANWKLVFRAFA